MTGDANPAHYAANEFLDSPFAFPNGTVYALIHTEYPGNDYGNCTGPAYPRCWTVSVGLGVSHDWGATWAHARPPPAMHTSSMVADGEPARRGKHRVPGASDHRGGLGMGTMLVGGGGGGDGGAPPYGTDADEESDAVVAAVGVARGRDAGSLLNASFSLSSDSK